MSPDVQLPSGNDPAVLPGLTGWNWGAYGLSWIWALAHRLYLLGLLTLLGGLLWGLIGIALSIYLGLRGNELAWQRRPFRDVDDFRRVQQAWRPWGIAVFAVQVIAFAAVIFIAVFLFARAAQQYP